MNRLRTFTMATLVALAFTACDEAEVVTPPPPPPTPVGTIGGLVLIEGTGATGVTVTLSSGTTTQTGAGGVFAFTGVEAGSYSVSISGFADDVTFTNTTQLAAINSDGQVVNLNFNGSYIRTSSIVGSVVVENRAGKHTMGMGMDLLGGLEGVTVRLGGDHAMGETDKTSSSGGFSFTGLRAGSYTVTLTGLPSNVRFESNEMSVDVGVGSVAEAHFTDGTEYYEEGTLRGRLYIDGNENDHYEMNVDGDLMVDSVVITLEGGTVGMNVTTMTDSTGSFEFKYLEEGSYRVWIDSKDEALKGENVTLRGTGRSETLEVKANSMASAYFGFDVDKFMAKVPVVYGNDGSGNTENPAAGVEVSLYTQPAGVSGRKQIGKTAKSDSTTGIATIEVARSILKDLPAKSIVFAEVADPTDNATLTGAANLQDVVDDEVVTFTLDKSQFSTTAPEDHNLLWRVIKLTANYVDQDGKPVRKAITDGDTPLVSFTGDFGYRAKSSAAWGDVPAGFGSGDDQTGARISDKKSVHNGAWQVSVTEDTFGDATDGNTNPQYGQYGLVDVTSATADLVFREEGATADSTRSGVARVKTKGASTVTYDGSDFAATTGTSKHQVVAATVDGSSDEVHLGDFVVSYPHSNVTFTVYRERNDVPGYQDAKADKKNPDAAEPTPDVTGAYTLRFAGDDANGDKYGTITCDWVPDSDNNDTNVVNCPMAPANADTWTLIASRGLDAATPPKPVTVEDATIRFLPLPFPGAMVQTDADSAATATATAEATDMAYAFDVGTALEALVGAKVPGVLGWKYQNQTLNFTAVNETGVVASAAPPADATGAVGVADLTVTAMLSESALGYNAARDTLHTVKKTTAAGLAAFSGLLEGSYTVTVVKHNVKTSRTMRAVLYDSKDKRSGEADLAGYESARQVVYDASRHDSDETVRGTSAFFQEVEYRGSISGYVFNASNDNALVDGFETLGAGYMVMAQKMKPDTNGACTVPDPDNRKKDGDPMSVATNEKGMYTFNIWEGCYDIMTDTTYMAQPDARKGFTVDETAANLTRAATEAVAVNFNDGNADTDFEVIYSSGSVVVQTKLLSGGNATDTAIANMNVSLFKCKLGPDVDKLGGTVPLTDCDASNERTGVKGGLKTTASNGTATWTDLEEGWYVAEPQPATTDGVEYDVDNAQGDTAPKQVFQPTARPVTVYIRLNVPKATN